MGDTLNSFKSKNGEEAVPICISVPRWMRDWMQENHLRPSKIMQDAVLRLKEVDIEEERLRKLVDKQLGECLQGDGIPIRRFK